jgi:NitT/TauT family transport system substrate-binding protein
VKRLEFLISALAASIVQASPASARSERTIRAGMGPVEEAAVLYYAAERGLFARAGLDVTLSIFSSGGQVGQALVGGALDVGVLNTGALASAFIRGLPLRLIACGGIYTPASPIAHLVVGPTTGIRTPKDLAGKTIAVSTVRDMVQAATMAWIDRHGGDSKAVDFAEIPNVAMAEALGQNRVHGAVMLEPYYTRNKNKVVLIGLVYEAVNGGRPFQTLGIIGNKDWIDANRDAAGRVASAIRAAARWANGNHAQCVPLLARVTKIAPEIIASYPRIAYAESNDPGLVQPVVDVMARYGFLPSGFDAARTFAPASTSRS